MAMKVLVVEDNDDVRAMVVEVLRMDPGVTRLKPSMAATLSTSQAASGLKRGHGHHDAADGRPRSDETHQARLARNKGDCGDRVHPGRVPGSGI